MHTTIKEDNMVNTMQLGLFLLPAGHHLSAWRAGKGSVPVGHDVEYLSSLVRMAEEGGFHFAFLADNDALWRSDPVTLQRDPNAFSLEPLTLLGALARETTTLGLIATASTSYNEPYALARRFATLDLLSNGRAGWNIVTSFMPQVAQNFGGAALPGHDDRYRRAQEFLEVVDDLWKSWPADIVKPDPATGLYLSQAVLPTIDHHGESFQVRGPLNVPRSPQGRPLLVQAGTSPAGLDFAGRWAEVLFTIGLSLEESRRQRETFRERLEAEGREPDSARLMPGMLVLIEEEDPWGAFDELQRYVDPHDGLTQLKDYGFGLDMSEHDWSDPFPETAQTDGQQGRRAAVQAIAARHRMTIEQVARLVAVTRGHHLVVGTSEEVADEMEHWFTGGACDGFNVMPARFPRDLEQFCEKVVPILEARGLVRRARPELTLRENLGLAPIGNSGTA
jgi:FMN-dependent oxidoreductase (nitrilotriacetate monooxygenase family)